MLIAVLAIALLIGAASAAVLTYYGKITGTVSVAQSVLVDGLAYPDSMGITYTIDGAVAGNSYKSYHELINRANVPAVVRLDTSVSDPVGVTVSYQLVTTPFGKRGGWAGWTTEDKYSGEWSVKMWVPAIPAEIYNVGALVQIPITPTTLDNVPAFGTMTFKVKGDWDKVMPYYQLKLDLGSNDFGRFVVMQPGEKTIIDETGEWDTGKVTADSWYIWAFSGTSVGAGPKTLTDWHTWLTTNYPSYKVLFVDVQYGWWGPTVGGTIYVDSVTYGDATWDLEWDALQSVDLTAIWNDNYVVIPTDSEVYGFTITISLAINAQEGTYTVETYVTAIP
jgi:hypothetical protein